MEHTFLMTDDMLWDYADGLLSAADKARVESELLQNPEWQQRLRLIQAEKQELFSLPLETPGAGFADRVMSAWAAEHMQARAKAEGKDWIIRLIALVFVWFVLLPVVVMLVTALQVTPAAAPLVNLPELPNIPAAEWSRRLSNPAVTYSLLLGLVFVGLRFLDKYLQHRRLAHELGY
ncbi:MAG: hypothetical protein IT260_02380 [Saprospiraceae bacterium]|nr:hypothetical protein [Saprospiraceae bacterium]